MKVFRTVREIKEAITGGVLKISENVCFLCDFSLEVDLKISGDIDAGNIKAGDIDAWDIKAVDIKARDIDAGNIKAGDIDAWDIKAGDIFARDIDAENIKAGDIKAWDIDAENISYYAFCLAYNTIKCCSHKGRRKNAKAICLDTDIEIREGK